MNWAIMILTIVVSRVINYLLGFNYNIVSDPFDLKLFVLDIGIFAIIFITINYIYRNFVSSPSEKINDPE